jgi:hypothetical protein
MSSKLGIEKPLPGLRKAGASDALAVFEVLTGVARGIPLELGTSAQQKKCRAEVEEWCKEGLSWISLDVDGRVVGFLLGTEHPGSLIRFQFEGIVLEYGGIKEGYRDKRRFHDLLLEAKTICSPLLAVVKRSNRGAMAKRLIKAGFDKANAFIGKPDEDVFIWRPNR